MGETIKYCKITAMNLKFIKSNKKSFDTYKSWFRDKTLNMQLGPMDNETWEKWQEYTINGEKSEELATYLGNELVAVVEISLPTKDYPENCITAIATNPQKKRMGIGTAVLKQLLKSDKFADSNIWIAHVAPDNVAAISFFEKHDWKQRNIDNDMITYEFISNSGR